MSRVRVNLDTREFEIEGAEEFVNKGINDLKEIVQAIQPLEKNNDVSNSSVSNGSNELKKSKADFYREKFIEDGLIYNEDDKLMLNFDVPGKSNSEKTRNCAIIMSFFKNHVSKDEIKEAVKKQGAYDNKNFSGYLRKVEKKIIITGNGKEGFKISITRVGEKSAVDLLNKVIDETDTEVGSEINLF